MSDRADEDSRGLAALGAAIEALRTQAGLSANELAARTELPPRFLAAIEAGREEPTWGDLRRLAQGLETPLEELLELAESLERTGPGPA
ncbi:MAG TPA: helix-turn-helix transcriptional regulator [Solirubrobacterales bacterium]|nr:helix-turn-helix transcriptional regulator [Solirubrobacterales bacterium]